MIRSKERLRLCEPAAQRVELCANLFEGGTTPSLGMIQAVRQATSLDVMVLIRPRGGDFCFSDHEVDVMLRDIDAAAEARAHGVAIGALSPDGQVDRAIVRLLVDAARPMSITFHRAFDWTCNPYEALDCLVELGVDRVLTSGQEQTAELGIPLLRDLQQQAAGQIAIMPGGGVHEDNIAMILSRTGARQIHFSASELVERPQAFHRSGVSFIASSPPNERQMRVTSEQRIRNLRKAAMAAGPQAPNLKHQIPNKTEAPNSDDSNSRFSEL